MHTILLLHGAIGAANQLKDLENQLSTGFMVYSFNFTGHGGNPIPEDDFSIELFAENVLDFMEKTSLDHISVFGYSMGGYVAMWLAKNHPDKIDRVITLGTKFHWDESTAQNEVRMLDPEKISKKIPAFADTLKQRHAPADWTEVLRKTGKMMVKLGNNNPLKPADYPLIKTPALILLGDRDKMVTLEETLDVYKALPDARLGILPGTPHQVEQVNVGFLSYLIRDFVG